MLALHAAGVPHEAIGQLFESSDLAARQRFVRAKRDLTILALRSSGSTWSDIAVALGLDASTVEKRHARLASRSSANT